MSIITISKKLQKAFASIRRGETDAGILLLRTINGFEPQKAIALAEINYFRGRYEEAMLLDEQALPCDTQWYSGSVLTEHLFAYTTAALTLELQNRATVFLKNFLHNRKCASLPDHRINFYGYQVEQHLKLLSNEQNLPISPKALPLLTNGKPKQDFLMQLKENRPSLSFESAEGASYLLHFMFEEAESTATLEYYEQFAPDIRYEQHHINAARLYLKKAMPEKAMNALRIYASRAWFPVEHMQVVPMGWWAYKELHPILTENFLQEILSIPKAIS